MLDIGHDFKQIDPNWSDTLRADQAAVVRRQFGDDNAPSPACGRAASAFESSTPTDARRAQDDLRVRAVRHRRGRRPDDVPPASRLGRARAVRRRPDWSPFMDPDVFPNSLEYWGPTGHGAGSATSSSAGRRSTTTTQPSCSRSSGRAPAATRASTPTASSCRTSSRASRCRTSPAAYKAQAELGLRAGRRHLREIKWDDVLDDPFDLSGSATGWGINSARTSTLGKNDVLRAAASSSARASRTT